MRRVVALLACVVLAACTQSRDAAVPEGDGTDVIASVVPSTAEPSVTPSPQVTLEPTQTCDGLGKVPPEGEITFVRDGRLIAASPDGKTERCLAELAGIEPANHPLGWNALGDRVIVGGQAFSADLTGTRELAREPSLEWSRPSGTSVVWVSDEGRLMKSSSLGGKAIDISFLARHDDVTYHPAGTHIATTGETDGGAYGLFLATNVGARSQWLARGEKAKLITNLSFSEDGEVLHYTARHGPENWHLHSLFIGIKASLATLTKHTSDLPFAVSPFNAGKIAWFRARDCAEGEPGTLKLSGYRTNIIEIPTDLRANNLIPVGWMRGGLVVESAPVGCDANQTRSVYYLSSGSPVLIAEDIDGRAGVRVRMPRPPPPPSGEQEVVA